MTSMAKLQMSKEDKKLVNQLYVDMLQNFMATAPVTQHSMPLSRAILKGLDVWYKDDPDTKNQIFVRHVNEFFNSHQVFEGMIAGIVFAMEKQRAETGGGITVESISSVKASLMGPLAGIGDSFFFNAHRVIVAGVAIGLAAGGNFLGPLFFLLAYGGVLLVVKYFAVKYGYVYGTELISSAYEKGIIPLVSEATTVLGGMMIGALIASNVKVAVALAPTVNGATIVLQEVLDSVAVGVLSLALWWVVFRALQKGWKPVQLIFTIMGACVLLTFFGIL